MQHQLFVTVKAERNGNAAIQVYSNEGKLVKKQNSGLLPGTNRLTVDAHVADGVISYRSDIEWWYKEEGDGA